MLLFTSFQPIIQRTGNLSASAEVARRTRDDETQSAEHHQHVEKHPPNVRLNRRNPMMDVAPQNHYIYNMSSGLRANVQAEHHAEKSVNFIIAGKRAKKMEQTAHDDCKQN
jgi:hypothetical protein